MNLKEIIAKLQAGEELTDAEKAYIEKIDEEKEDKEFEAQASKLFEAFEKKYDLGKKEVIVDEKKIAKEQLEKMSDEEVKADFIKAVVCKDVVSLQKYVNTGTPSAGGYAKAPAVLEAEVLNYLKEETVMMANAKVRLNAPATWDISQFTALPVAYFRGEAGRKTASTPAFGKQTITPYSVSVFVGMTEEMIEDAINDMPADIIDSMKEALNQKFDEVFAAGDGVGKPTGLDEYYSAQPAAFKITAAKYASLADRIIAAPLKLKKQYRARAKWYMNSEQAEIISLLKDSNGRQLLNQDLTGEFDYRLKGRPVEINDNLTNIWYGDLYSYWIGQRGGINLAESADASFVDGETTHNSFQDNMRALRLETRVDGELVNRRGLIAIEPGTAEESAS